MLWITAGVVSAGFGLKGFLLPNGFVDGGVTGISLLVEHVTGIHLAPLLIVINIPFLIVGMSQIGRLFALRSIAAITTLALAITFITYPVITSDKLLVAVFGGFFIGAGIGLAVRGGAVLDGTEVMAVWLNRITGLTMGDVILLFNILIFGVAAMVLTMEAALYSILTYLAASKTVDFIVEGVDEYMGVTIISPANHLIRQMIIEEMGRGVTLYSGKGGYSSDSKDLKTFDIVYTVITRLELTKLKREVQRIDAQAFIVMNQVRDIRGGVIKKRPLKH